MALARFSGVQIQDPGSCLDHVVALAWFSGVQIQDPGSRIQDSGSLGGMPLIRNSLFNTDIILIIFYSGVPTYNAGCRP